MRHLKTGRKFGRNSANRKALFKSLSISLIEHEAIKTTLPKAKELRGCLLYTSPSPRDKCRSRMPSSA